MELYDKLKKIMADQFGIHTDRELLEAIQKMERLDIGIFRKEMEAEDGKTA